MAHSSLLQRVNRTLHRLQVATPRGDCMIEGHNRGAVFVGLCPDHYREALEGKLPTPGRIRRKGRCATRVDSDPSADGSPYCREHTDYFRSMKDGALIPAVREGEHFQELEIRVDAIRPGDYAMMPSPTDEDVRSLAQSLLKNPQINPIGVMPGAKGGYVIIFGHRRWLAAQLVGMQTIRCILIPRSTPDERVQALIADENLERQRIPPFALSVWIIRLHERDGLTYAQVADLLRMSEREVLRYVRAVAQTHPRVREAYLRNEIGLMTAVNLSRLKPATQAQALEGVLAKPTRSERRKAAAGALRAELRTLFRAWRSKPGASVTVKGGTVCIAFPDEEALFEQFFIPWVYPRLRRPGGVV